MSKTAERILRRGRPAAVTTVLDDDGNATGVRTVSIRGTEFRAKVQPNGSVRMLGKNDPETADDRAFAKQRVGDVIAAEAAPASE